MTGIRYEARYNWISRISGGYVLDIAPENRNQIAINNFQIHYFI